MEHEAEEAAARLEALEMQAWLDLDAFLRALASRTGDGMRAPAQLVALMPPPPAAGWPDEFLIQRVAVSLRQKAAARRSMGMFSPSDDPEPFVPCGSSYLARRRAQRFSFALWATISRDNRDLVRALETTSTAERLRLAMRRLRELREQMVQSE